MRTEPELHLHPDAIQHNIVVLREYLKSHTPHPQPSPRIWAVAKADAYGHGLQAMLSGFAHADGLAVSDVDVIHTCRQAGWEGPVLLMAGGHDIPDLHDPVLKPLHLVISHAGQLAQLTEQSKASLDDVHIWLRFAGTLNHAGLKASDYARAFRQLDTLRSQGKIASAGHLQHYSHAEDRAHLDYEKQLFNQLIHDLPGPICSQNSASILNDPTFSANTDWIRSGILLYGVDPLGVNTEVRLALRPAMTLRAPIYAIQHLEPGDCVGYGGTFRTSHAMRVALVRCGYAHGYPRLGQAGCPCRIHGRPARLIGRVSMDTLCIDITECPDADIGHLVSLWGEYGLSADHVARAAGTIAAQLFTGITGRVTRYYPGDCGYQGPRT